MKLDNGYRVLFKTALFLLFLYSSPIDLSAQESASETPKAAEEEALVSVDIVDGNVREVLRGLANQAGTNVAITEAVTGRITVSLRNVRWEAAFDTVVKTAGLVCKRQADLVTVMTPPEAGTAGWEDESGIFKTKVIAFEFVEAKALQEAFKALLSPDGQLTIEEKTNSLIISDTERNINKLVSLAGEIDIMPRKILIEVLMADMVLNDEKDLGVNWSLGKTSASTSLDFAQDLVDTAGDGGTVTYNLLRGNWSYSYFIRALERVEKARILATPKILVLSGEEASIETIEEIPYQELTETSAGGQIGTTAFKEAGVKLHVTPKIIKDGRIHLTILAEQSASTGESINDVPIINTRKADTTLLLNEGETLVIGGLRREEKSKTISQVPLLGDIPVLGAFFRYTNEVVENRDLVIFLTPRLFEEQKFSKGERKILVDGGYLEKLPSEIMKERIHEMAKDVEQGNVIGIRHRLGDLRSRLQNNQSETDGR